MKGDCWEQIEQQFNASSRNEYRSAKVLTTKYKNMKKRSRKSFTDRKIENKATGGGPYRRECGEEKSQTIDEKVQSLMGKSCTGLQPQFDDGKIITFTK